jgi:diadenosine tetraphosphatase ApaH/serine/threonine PP2A family protein phosphatase
MGTCLLLADIHSNVRALDAVLVDAARRGAIEALWVLGDVVGYGAEPNECIQRLHDYDFICVAGNHDLGAIGCADLSLFNADAAAACRWTASRLTDASAEFLASLSWGTEVAPFLLVHGSPRDPVWEYIVSAPGARATAQFCPQQHCLVGHTHVPALLPMDACAVSQVVGTVAEGCTALREGRFLINPGSVGQPRDGDPRAAFAEVDLHELTVRFRRVSYDVEAAAVSVMEAGLPRALAARLLVGF